MFDKKPKKDKFMIKKQLISFFSPRLVMVGMLICILFGILVYRLFVLQIIEGKEHLSNFKYKVEKTIETSGARGNIYDCQGKLLAYNQLAYSITLANDDSIKKMAAEQSKEEKRKVSENEIKNEVIYKLIQVLEANGDKIAYDLPLKVNGKGKLVFTETGGALTRFKKDIYGIIRIEDLKGDEKKKAEHWMNSSPEEVYEYLRMGTDGPAGSGNMFEISEKYSVEDTLKIMSVRFDSYMNRYSQTTPITVASNISNESIAEIAERKNEFPGVEIKADSLRKYNDAKYLSGIIGYTGVISESELEEYNANHGDYEADDVVGKTGIEKTMEGVLQGKKGKQKVLVDNLGKVITTVDTTEASAGNNIYLTIDLELQKYAYNILERRLAGIVLAHLTTAEEPGSNKMIPIKDVYFSLIDNNIIDVTRLNAKNAEKNEKEVYALFEKKQEQVMKSLRRELSDGTTIRKNLSDERREYVDYIYNLLIEDGVLSTTMMDEKDEVCQAWKEERITIKKFLQHAINQEWIDITAFNIKADYYSGDEIYAELINYIVDTLKSDEAFDKILYKYMIKNGELSGKRVCLLLFDQNVLNKDRDKHYEALLHDQLSAYNFMYQKIKNLEITPAQLALDPCSGSVIITDPDTGAVKAMVSYPSYDNNRLANGIDSSYYAALNSDKSSPMLNRCTQTRTAPGSTFKPVSATAALQEGIIDGNDYIKDKGIFEEITPSPKCWIYPNAHGSLNVSGAIAVSCNYFFYKMGYELGSSNGTYNSTRGLDKLKKYARLYGFDRKSGVEITEYEPHISDEDAVRSAIGQGTNSFAPVQIARYVTSLVNEEDLVSLSLLDKTTDAEGNVLTTFEKKTEDSLDVDDSTFALIKRGMRDVVNGKDSSIKFLYKKQGLNVAGKTGTAQENKSRPNHALFISYAPYNDPDIAMTVVVPNGYTSTNAAEIARDIYKYYFKKTSKAEKKATTALMPTGNDSSND